MILSYLGRVRQGAELCISKPPPVFPAGAAVSLLVEDVAAGGLCPAKSTKTIVLMMFVIMTRICTTFHFTSNYKITRVEEELWAHFRHGIPSLRRAGSRIP